MLSVLTYAPQPPTHTTLEIEPLCALAALTPASSPSPSVCCSRFRRLQLTAPSDRAGRSLVMRMTLIELKPGVHVVKISKDTGASMEVGSAGLERQPCRPPMSTSIFCQAPPFAPAMQWPMQW